MNISINGSNQNSRIGSLKKIEARTIAAVAGLTLAVSSAIGLGVAINNSGNAAVVAFPAANSIATQEQIAAYAAQELAYYGADATITALVFPSVSSSSREATPDQIAVYAAQEMMAFGDYAAAEQVILASLAPKSREATASEIANYSAQEIMAHANVADSASVNASAAYNAQVLAHYGADLDMTAPLFAYVSPSTSREATSSEIANFSAQEVMAHGNFSNAAPVGATAEQLATYAAQELMAFGDYTAAEQVFASLSRAASASEIATYSAQEIMEHGNFSNVSVAADATPEQLATYAAQELMAFGIAQ